MRYGHDDGGHGSRCTRDGGALRSAGPTTKDKVENKMEQAKDSAKSTTQEAKTAVSDSWVTSKAKIALSRMSA